MKRKLSPQALCNLRRLRLARRLWKREPLFAFTTLKEKYSDCTYEQFLSDLVRRSKPKPKKAKSSLARYGRYTKMIEQIKEFKESGDIKAGLHALKLRRLMCQPYRIRVVLNGIYKVYFFSPLESLTRIDSLYKTICKCKSEQEVEDLVEAFTKYSRW